MSLLSGADGGGAGDGGTDDARDSGIDDGDGASAKAPQKRVLGMPSRGGHGEPPVQGCSFLRVAPRSKRKELMGYQSAKERDHPAEKTEQDRSAGVTAAIAQASSELTFESLPDEIVELTRQCLLDWLGVTIAGTREPLVQILVDEAAEQGGHPQATLIGRSARVSTRQAALVNGAASHALDYDDVNWTLQGHPSVAIIPGLLALAEFRGASGRDFIAAFVAGYETACRVGRLVSPSHYQRGFHATSTA